MISLTRFDDSRARDVLGRSCHFAASEEYLAFHEAFFGHEILVAFNEETGVGLALRVQRLKAFKIGQILSPPLIHGERPAASEEMNFLQELLLRLRRDRICHILIQPPPHCLFQVRPPGTRGCPFGSYVVNLQERSEEELMAAMHPDHRREIRNASRQGTIVRFGADQVEPFYNLHAWTMRRAGCYCASLAYFHAFYAALAQRDHVLCGVAYFDGTPMAGIMVPCTESAGCYLYGGSRDSVKPSGAVKLLHWETIRSLRARGVRRYDLVGARLGNVTGTPFEHLQRFKKRFGARLEKGWLWKANLNWPMACLFRFGVLARRAAAGMWRVNGDIIDQETQAQGKAGRRDASHV